MKCKVSALMLMLLVCWASQSSAQPTRAESHLLVADASRNVIAPQKITPSIIRQFNKESKDFCVVSEHQNYREGRPNRIEATFDPVRNVAEWLDGFYNIAPKNSGQVKVLQEPKRGKLVSTIYHEPIRAAHKLNTQYDLTSTSFKYVPDNSFKYDPNKDILGVDRVKFQVTLNNKKFVLSYVIKVVMTESLRDCNEGDDLLASNMELIRSDIINFDTLSMSTRQIH